MFTFLVYTIHIIFFLNTNVIIQFSRDDDGTISTKTLCTLLNYETTCFAIDKLHRRRPDLFVYLPD